MGAINVVALQAVPNVLARQCGHRPVITLADHLLSDLILPLDPFQLWVGGDAVVQDDYGEIQGLKAVARQRA